MSLIDFYFCTGWCVLVLIFAIFGIALRKKLYMRFRGPVLLLIYSWLSIIVIFVYYLPGNYLLVKYLYTGSFFAFEMSILLGRGTSIFAQILHSHFHLYKEYIYTVNKRPFSIQRAIFEDNTWILEYRIYYVMSFFNGILLTLVYLFSTRLSEFDQGNCTQLFVCSWQLNLLYASLGLLFCYVAKTTVDTYGILTESKHAILVTIVHYCCIFTIPFLGLNDFTLFLVHFCFIAIRHIVLIIAPIIKYACTTFEKKDTSVDEILNSPEHLILFMKNRYCVDYLMFLKAVQQFKNDFKNMNAVNGRRLYKKFFRFDSMFFLDAVPNRLVFQCDYNIDNESVIAAFDEIADFVLENVLNEILRIKVNY